MPQSPCWPRHTLKDYLNGSTDDQRLLAIESHLAECEVCEQTLSELESDPDTLVQSVRGPGDELGLAESQANSAVVPAASVIQRAVDAVKAFGGPALTSGDPLAKPDEIRWQQIGAYDLLHPLGRGGMGVVMMGRHRTLKKQVAIKILPRVVGDRPELVQRFHREIVTSGRLNHPAIVHATDAGAEQGVHYLVMEYIDGLDLSRIARSTGMLPIADACEVARQAALGLSYAHAQGVVHRDIKPSNLMLDKAGHVKILDFGLAQLNMWDEGQAELTTVGQLMGTLDYMAPEQAERFGAVDYRADLYALGATLFRLLAGRAPLAASPHMTLVEKVRLIGSQSAPLVSTLRSDCPATLVKLIEQLLARDPAQRPASAAHVAEALLPHCAGHNLSALVAQCHDRASSPPAMDNAPAQIVRTMDSENSQPPRRRVWTMLAWMLPILFLAGIFITLETQKGQLIIESDVVGIKVNLLKDGKVARQLQIETGVQATRVFADIYDVEIAGGSDSVSIDQNVVEIRRGATVVARIREERNTSTPGPALSLPNKPAVPAAEPNANTELNTEAKARKSEPMYAGQTLAQWLDVLERDLDSQSRFETLPAVKQLVESGLDAETQARVAEVLCRAIASEAKRVEWHYSLWRLTCGNSELLSRIAEILVITCGHKSAFELLRDKCLMDNGKLTKDTFAILTSSALSQGMNGYACRWLFEGDRFRQLDEDLAWRALDFLERSLQFQDAWLFEELPRRVQDHPQLGHKALLQLRAPDGARTRPEIFTLEEFIAVAARDAFLSNDSTPPVVALAAARLARTDPIIDSFRAELVAKLAERLKALSQNQSQLLAAVDVNPPGVPIFYNGTVAVDLAAFDMTSAKADVMNSSISRYFGSEIVSMLALAIRLRATRELDEALTATARPILAAAKPWLVAEVPPSRGSFQSAKWGMAVRKTTRTVPVLTRDMARRKAGQDD